MLWVCCNNCHWFHLRHDHAVTMFMVYVTGMHALDHKIIHVPTYFSVSIAHKKKNIWNMELFLSIQRRMKTKQQHREYYCLWVRFYNNNFANVSKFIYLFLLILIFRVEYSLLCLFQDSNSIFESEHINGENVLIYNYKNVQKIIEFTKRNKNFIYSFEWLHFIWLRKFDLHENK